MRQTTLKLERNWNTYRIYPKHIIFTISDDAINQIQLLGKYLYSLSNCSCHPTTPLAKCTSRFPSISHSIFSVNIFLCYFDIFWFAFILCKVRKKTFFFGIRLVIWSSSNWILNPFWSNIKDRIAYQHVFRINRDVIYIDTSTHSHKQASKLKKKKGCKNRSILLWKIVVIYLPHVENCSYQTGNV